MGWLAVALLCGSGLSGDLDPWNGCSLTGSSLDDGDHHVAQLRGNIGADCLAKHRRGGGIQHREVRATGLSHEVRVHDHTLIANAGSHKGHLEHGRSDVKLPNRGQCGLWPVNVAWVHTRCRRQGNVKGLIETKLFGLIGNDIVTNH